MGKMEYYPELLERLESLNREENFDFYIFLKISMYLSLDYIELDLEEISPDRQFIVNGVLKCIKDANENEYIELCNDAKFVFDIDSEFTPRFIIMVKRLMKNDRMTEYLFRAISKYFNIDTTITNREHQEICKLLSRKINEDFGISINHEIL